MKQQHFQSFDQHSQHFINIERQQFEKELQKERNKYNILLNECEQLEEQIIILNKQLIDKQNVKHRHNQKDKSMTNEEYEKRLSEIENRYLSIQQQTALEMKEMRNDEEKWKREKEYYQQLIYDLRKKEHFELISTEINEHYPYIEEYHLKKISDKLTDVYILNASNINQTTIVLPIVKLSESTEKLDISRDYT